MSDNPQCYECGDQIDGEVVWWRPFGGIMQEGIVQLSKIGMTDPQYARFTTGLESIILGGGQPSFC